MTNEKSLELVKVQKEADTFLAIGNNLVERANTLAVAKIEDIQVATVVLKECQSTEQLIEERRVSITKPINDFVKEVNVLFKEVSLPLLTAKNTVSQKILNYNQEQERIRKEEEAKRFAEEQARLRKLEEERLERERIETAKREAEEKKLRDAQERLRKLDEARIAKEASANKASIEEQNKLRAEAEKQRLEREKLEKERLEIERQKRESEEDKKRIEEERKSFDILKAEVAERARKEIELKVKGIRKTWQWEIVAEISIPRVFCSPDNKKINEAIKSGVRVIDGLRIFEATRIQ